MEIIKTLREFLIENFLFEEDESLTNETSFLENGILSWSSLHFLRKHMESKWKMKK